MMKVLKFNNFKLNFIKKDFSKDENKTLSGVKVFTDAKNKEVSNIFLEKKENIGFDKENKIQKKGLNPQSYEKEINKLIEELNKKLNPLNKVLKVEIDKDLKIPIFKIVDKDTKEVIRQIPLEEILKLRKNLEKLGKMFQEHEKIRELKGLTERINLKGVFLRKEV
jgi:flagellar protein FlaG